MKGAGMYGQGATDWILHDSITVSFDRFNAAQQTYTHSSEITDTNYSRK